MGTGNERKVCFYMMVDGHPVAVEPKFAEITYAEQNEKEAIAQECKCEIKMKLPKGVRCRNKKRFVKLLMSYGISRNVAVSVAKIIALRNERDTPEIYRVSYQGYFIDLVLFGKLRKKEN